MQYSIEFLPVLERESARSESKPGSPPPHPGEVHSGRTLGHVSIVTANAKNGAATLVFWWFKRILDLAGAATLILVLLPVFVLIAILIKLDSRGPTLFVQERVGSRRRVKSRRVVWEISTFKFYKFRSMHRDADQAAHERYIRDFCNGHAGGATESGTRFKLSNDSRVTRIGRALRQTSLDELPQLFNVLRGDMSLVGPRPVPTYEVAHYRRAHFRRLAALPGITGLWQVRGRGQVPFEEMIRLDVEYIERASIWLDLRILMMTVPAVFSGRGAG